MLSWRWALAAAVCVGPALVVAQEEDAAGVWKEKKKDDGRVVQEMKIEAPSFTEEDQYGYNMPDLYRCDSCRAVMFHLNLDLTRAHPKSRKMKSWEYTELFDETCRNSFGGYGVKLVNGENALGGPGLPQADSLAPGMGAIQMGGETWSKRLGEICRKIVYEKMGEDDIYEAFYKKLKDAPTAADSPTAEIGISDALCSTRLRECDIGPKPAKRPNQEKAVKAEKPKKKKTERAPKHKNVAAGAAKTAAAKKPAAAATSSAPVGAKEGEPVDVQTFLRSLAVKHGLTSDEYLTTRSARDWEKLTVAMAGRIFNKAADGADGSCQA